MRRDYHVIIKAYEVGSIKRQHYKQVFLQRLKEEHEGRCTPYGYVKSIDKIISYGLGEIYDCDLSGNIVYTVTAEIDVVNYKPEQIITITLDSKNEGMGAYISVDEPFVFFVYDDGKEISLHEPVEVTIKGKRIVPEENKIHIMAELI